MALFIQRNRVHCVRSVDVLLPELKVGRQVLSQMRMAEGRVGLAAIDVASTYALLPVDSDPPVTLVAPAPRRATGEHFSAEPVDGPAAVAPRELDAIDRGAVSYVAPYASSYEASRDVGSMSEYSTPGFGVELGGTL